MICSFQHQSSDVSQMPLKNRYKYSNTVSHAGEIVWKVYGGVASSASSPHGCYDPSVNAETLEKHVLWILHWSASHTHNVPHQQRLNRWEPLGKCYTKIVLSYGGLGVANCAPSFEPLKQVKSFSGNVTISSLFRLMKCLCSLAFIEVIERLHPLTTNWKNI